MLNKKRKLIMVGSILGLSTISTAIGLGIGLNQTKQTQINHTESKIDSNKSQVLIKKEKENKEELKSLKYEYKTTQFIEEVKNNNLKPKELSTKPLKDETVINNKYNKIDQLVEELKTTSLESSNQESLETITTTDFNTNTSIQDNIKYRWTRIDEKSRFNLQRLKQLHNLTLDEIKQMNHIEVGELSNQAFGLIDTYKLGLKTQIFENKVVLSLSHEDVNSDILTPLTLKYKSFEDYPLTTKKIYVNKYEPDSVYLYNSKGYKIHWYSQNKRSKDGKKITDAVDNFVKFDFKLVFNKNTDGTYSLDDGRKSKLSLSTSDFIVNYYYKKDYYQGDLKHYRLNPITINTFSIITKNEIKEDDQELKEKIKSYNYAKKIQHQIDEFLKSIENTHLKEIYKNKTIEDLIIKKEE